MGHCCSCKPPAPPPKPKKKTALEKFIGLVKSLLTVVVVVALGAPVVAYNIAHIYGDISWKTGVTPEGDYWKYKKAVANFNRALRGLRNAGASVSLSHHGPDLTAIIEMIPLPKPPRPVGFGLGCYGLDDAEDRRIVPLRKKKMRKRCEKVDKQHPRPNELAQMMGVINKLVKQIGGRIKLKPCKIDLIIKGFADGHTVIPGSRYTGRHPIYRKFYRNADDCCEVAPMKTLKPNELITNIDIAFLRAYYTELFIKKSALHPYVRTSRILAREECERGGCFRKVELTIHFEGILQHEFGRLFWITRWWVWLGL